MQNQNSLCGQNECHHQNGKTESVFIVPNLERPLLSRKCGVPLNLFKKLKKLMRSLRR